MDLVPIARSARIFLAALIFTLWVGPVHASGHDAALGDGKKLLPAVTYKNLTLLPVARDTAKPAAAQAGGPAAKLRSKDDYEVLDEGMRRGKVRVHEQESGATVNSLTISNDSNKPLFIMGGEVIIGGKQDRIIAKDTLIGPRSTEQIAVYCVEHGRWAGRKAAFETAGSLAHTELRKAAKYKSSQQEVWSEVSAKNRKRKTSNATDTYRDIAQGKGTAGSIKDYERQIGPKVEAAAAGRELLGFVVAMNGDIVAVEVFESPKLFAKLKNKILRSYYVEAVDQPVTSKARHVPSSDDITKFADRAEKAEEARSLVQKNKSSGTYNFSDEALDGSMLEMEEASPVKGAKPRRTKVYRSIHKK